MNILTRFPIRLKIMVSLLVALTLVVIAITFTMATFFHDDKQSYMNDWLSIAALGTAEETAALLESYAERVQVHSLILLNDNIRDADRKQLLQGVFDHFPELIGIALYEDGRELMALNDSATLSEAGLDWQAYQRSREENPLPLDRIAAGEVYVGNSTLTAKLPCFTLAVAQRSGDVESPVVIAALIRLDGLLRAGARFKVFEVMLVSTDGRLLAHPDLERVARHESANLPAEAAQVHDEARAGLTLEHVRNGTELIAGFASVDIGGITAAAEIPKSAAYLASRALLGRLMVVASALLLLVAVGGRTWARRITRPVERLSDATRAIAKGDFDIEVNVESRDEMGALAGSFNQMASELNAREQALHEAQSQLVQSEKMAAFGQLGAGIAHEVKNPLAGILGCAQISLMELEEGTLVHKNLQLIEKETERCKTIIENLLKFARQEKAVMEPISLNTVIEDAAAIVNHQLEINKVKLNKDLFPDLPPIHGNANQLQQVLINLFVNAQQAMEGRGGTVTVATRRCDDERIEIVVSDTGPGIPKEIQRRLFDPFFTTKPTGKGTGLGLSVSFGIVRDHSGSIEVDSEPGEGATFRITLPVLTEGRYSTSAGAA